MNIIKGNSNGGLKKTLNLMFKCNLEPSEGTTLHFVEFEVTYSYKMVHITIEDIEEVELWQTAVVGHLVGHIPKLGFIKKFIEKRWDVVALPWHLSHSYGWYIFRFDYKEDIEVILRGAL